MTHSMPRLQNDTTPAHAAMLYILYTLHEENMVIYSNELCKLFDILIFIYYS